MIELMSARFQAWLRKCKKLHQQRLHLFGALSERGAEERHPAARGRRGWSAHLLLVVFLLSFLSNSVSFLSCRALVGPSSCHLTKLHVIAGSLPPPHLFRLTSFGSLFHGLIHYHAMIRCAEGSAAAVAVPVAIGLPLAVDGAMTVYTGYASAEWPAAKATVTRFLAVPVAETEAEAEAETDEAHQLQQQQQGEGMGQLRARWHDVRRRIDRLLNSQHTLDFTVEFEYTLPDGSAALLSRPFVRATHADGACDGVCDVVCDGVCDQLAQEDVRGNVEAGRQLSGPARPGVSVVHDAGRDHHRLLRPPGQAVPPLSTTPPDPPSPHHRPSCAPSSPAGKRAATSPRCASAERRDVCRVCVVVCRVCCGHARAEQCVLCVQS